MAKPQIQYNPIAEAPAFTPPTVAQMGWCPNYPNATARARLTGAEYAGFYVCDTKTPVTAALTLGWGSETPDDPRLGRRDTRSAVYQGETEFGVEVDTPAESWTGSYPDLLRPIADRRMAWRQSFTSGTAPESLAIPYGAGFEGPDNPQQFIHRTVAYRGALRPSVVFDFAPEQWTTPLGAGCELPDSPAQFIARRLQAANMLAFTGDTLRTLTAAQILGWGVELPDDPRLGRKQRLVEYPASFWTAALEQYAVPALSWQPWLVDRAVRAKGLLEYPAICQTISLEAFPAVPNSWTPTYPDRLVRARGLVEYPALALTQGLEQWAIPPSSWQPVYPDRAVRAKCLPEYSACVWPSAVTVVPAPSNSWQPSLPDRVWKAARLAEHPAFAVLAGLEQFNVPPMSWAPSYPDRPVRAKGLPVYPATSATLAVEPWPVTTWQPIYPDRVARVRVSADGSFALVQLQTTAVTPVSGPDAPYIRAPRRPMGGSVQDQLPVVPPVAPALSWQGYQPDRVWRQTLPTAAHTFSMFLPSIDQRGALLLIADRTVTTVTLTDAPLTTVTASDSLLVD